MAAVAAAATLDAVGCAAGGAAEVCWGCEAVGSGNQVRREASGGVGALGCVLVKGSLFEWLDSEGRGWAAWRRRTEGGWGAAWRHWHYQDPWSSQGFQSLELRRQTAVQGCWLGGKVALISGSAIEEGKQVRARQARRP